MNLDKRLASFVPVIEELKSLKHYLEQISVNRNDEHSFDLEIQWIVGSVERLEAQMHSRVWPPVWWRLTKEDVDLVLRNFYRMDGDGGYVDKSKSVGKTIYIQEREEVMRRVGRIEELYKHARIA